MNPEFRRQLWLGFSTTRVVVLPLLLVACFAAAYTASNSDAARTLAITGAVLFAVLVFGMGTFAAGASVNDEVTDRTWDQQRMSAMQPWAMTWGKLGGASAYAWSGGALCLAVAVPAGLMGGYGSHVLQRHWPRPACPRSWPRVAWRSCVAGPRCGRRSRPSHCCQQPACPCPRPAPQTWRHRLLPARMRCCPSHSKKPLQNKPAATAAKRLSA